MQIKPSAAIRQNYNEIADLCRKCAEPIFLTKNGEGDLVVMDIETYARREQMLQLREEQQAPALMNWNHTLMISLKGHKSWQ